jgi:DNA (cytosine-5)-methyltransferase 1
MAGIEVVQSYEWWPEAAETHRYNLGSAVTVADIRKLPLDEFPRDVDVVVGSPPCTQFSYSNRGGAGDIQDGLKDVAKFLEVVDHVQPRFWAMENVPRVAGILERELGFGGSLERFAHLVEVIEVVDASEWGVPQRRKRMIAGRFGFRRLLEYRESAPTRTLGMVIDGLVHASVDPVYGWPVNAVTDNLQESPLTSEEERMNREQKQFHRVYNVMPFPEPMERPSRTVTALCTRVSRESLILPSRAGYRRPTVRERASLQSFPVAYQFTGSTHAARVKMIGNAVPPLLTYYVAAAMRGIEPGSLGMPVEAPELGAPVDSSVPNLPSGRHGEKRKFAAAIPGLRFGSGMRFDLENFPADQCTLWRMAFHYGNAKDQRTVIPTASAVSGLGSAQAGVLVPWMEKVRTEVEDRLGDFPDSGQHFQLVWRGLSAGRGPFELVDEVGAAADMALCWMPTLDEATVEALLDRVLMSPQTGRRKLARYADRVIAGIITSAWVNSHFERHGFLQKG